MSTQMVNFRVKDHELTLIDKYAKMEGLSRSDWIRNAINRALKNNESTVGIELKERKGTNDNSQKCKFGDARQCPANKVKLATGIKVCQTCGLRSS